MFGKKKRDREEGRKRADAYERYRHRTKKGKSLSAAAADLCNIADRDKLLEVAEQVLKQTQAEEADIFQKYDRSVPGPPGKGDWATWPGAFITEVIRQHSCDPQTVWNALGDELPDVRFKVEEYDAIALVAAMLRTARQLGVVEGIELANAAVSNLKQ